MTDQPTQNEGIDHPIHYGGADTVYETIRVIDAWGLGFALGNCLKYISRAGKKPGSTAVQDLRKARWYLDHEIRRQSGGCTAATRSGGRRRDTDDDAWRACETAHEAAEGEGGW